MTSKPPAPDPGETKSYATPLPNSNDELRLQEWWDGWRKADYSWDGLAAKPWAGWLWDTQAECAVPAEGREASDTLIKANLQHQWWAERGRLHADPADGRLYTVVHAPLKWSDGAPTPKSISEDRWFIADELTGVLEKAMKPGGEVDLSGLVLHGPAAMPRLWITPGADLVITQAFIDGDLGFRSDTDEVVLSSLKLGGRIEGNLNLEGVRIRNRLQLSLSGLNGVKGRLCADDLLVEGRVMAVVRVKGEASFVDAVFRDQTRFERSCFLRSAKFVGCRFDVGAEFPECVFNGSVEFNRAVFGHDALFVNCVFLNTAAFWNTVFVGEAIFHQCIFDQGGGFSGAAFGGGLSLRESHFEEAALFAGRAVPTTDRNPQTVQLDLSPSGTGFEARGEFQSADVLSAYARRSVSAVDAGEAVFMRDADFNDRDFLQPSTFAAAWFLGELRMHGSRLHQRVNFHDAKFEALAYERLGAGASRVGDPWPEVRDELINARLRLAWHDPFKGCPPELQDRLRQEESERLQKRRADVVERVLTHDRTRASDARLESLEASYRTLKQAMEDTRSRLSESRFFKLELRARRGRRDQEVPAWERFASRLYGLTADYGDSISRPVLFLAGLAVAASVIYWLLAGLHSGFWSFSEFGDAIRYSFGRMTPFGAMSEEGAWVWYGRWSEVGTLFSWPGMIRSVATLQSAMALLLTFLFGLAVRRRFQIT
jgi:hypothetical protein